MIISPAEQLRQDVEYSVYDYNERVLKGMVIGFKELFKILPNIEARWRVWALGLDQMYFNTPALDIRFKGDPIWYNLDHWQGPLASEVDLYHRRDGYWTQETERQYIYFKDLPQAAPPHLYEIGSFAKSFNFSIYGNISFFGGQAKHWSKTQAADITKKFYGRDGDEDVLLSAVIHKDNYFNAITEVYTQPDFIERLRVEVDKEELERFIPTPSKTQSVSKI